MLHKRIFTIFFLFTFIFQGTFIIFKPALGAEEIPAEPAAGESEAGASDNNLPPDNNTTENNEIIGLGNENPDGESSPVDAETPADNNTENNEAVPEAAPQEEALTLDEDPDLPVDRNGENTFCKNCDLKQTNGALNYTYHFEIPKGRNGIEPEINLIYSQLNRAADSIAGYGWELNTGGYVEREKRKGIEDIYSLNEFKLNFNGGTSTLLPVDLTDSTHGQYGAKAEEAFFKYEFLDNDSWLVTDTRGTKYYYGQSAGSRQNPTGYTYKWMLDKIEDTNGNFVSFSYHKDSGQIYPEEIEYTKHGEEEGKYLIRFEPFATGTSTPASNYSYSSGAEVNTRYRVDKITVTVIGENNDDPIKEYRLDYGTKSLISYDFLTSIQEFGWNGSAFESLPEIEFEYNDGGTGWDYYNNNSGYPFDINPVSPYIWGDLNADSYDDFSRLESGKTVVKSYLNNTGAWWNYTDNWQMPYEEGLYDHRNNLLLDINNDGYADFLSFNNYSLLDVYINNKTDDWGGRQSSSGWYAYYPPNGAVIYADANADGLADTFSYSGCGGSTCYIAPIYNNGTTGWSASGQGPEIYESNNTRLLDYNNDGLSDIIEWNSQRAGKLITQIGSEDWREESFFVPGQNTDYLGNTLPFMFADINGDGLTDLITQGATSTEKFYFSNGKNGWSEAGDDWSEGLNPIYPVHHWFVDQNNDGFTDIISSSRELYRNNTAQPPYTLKKVKNNTGGEVDISYKNAKSYDNNSKMKSDMFVVEKISYYDREEKKEENTYSYEGGAHLREEDDPFSWEFRGFNEIKTADREGNYTLEFFHQGNETASSTGEFEDHISKKGKIYRQESYDANGNLYSLRINKYDKTDLGDGRFFPKLVSALTIDYDGNESYRAKASAFQYDSFGNITNKIDYGEVNSITGSGGFADTGTDLASTTISYIASTTPNIVGLPSRELLENQSGNKVRETKYYYDSLAFGSVSRGNLTKEERWKTGTSYVDIEKTYNSYGLITEEKDPRDKAASFTYDSSNLMVATSTNPLSQSTGYYYDYSSGKPIKTIDPNGRAFEIVLDAFDRVIEEKQPDIDTPSTLVLKSSYEYDDTGLPRMIKKTDYLTASSSVESYTYLDGFGRKIQERKKSEEENIYSVKDYAYNSRGLLDKETLPYFISGASSTPMTATSTLHILYSYDPLQRVMAVVNSIATTTSAYDDWKVTVIDGEEKEKGLYKDAYDNLVRVDEHNATSTYSTYYEYNLLNNLTKITDALGNVRNFTYDGLGRRLTAEDLHAAGDGTYGTWTYTFDDSGNLDSSLDPKSQTVNYAYDDINRILTENYAGQAGTETSYGYDACLNGKGRLCSATTTASVLNLSYNPLGLVLSERKTIATTTYETTYDYDRQANQALIILPDETEIKYEYNSAGLLEKVLKKEAGEAQYADVVLDYDYSPLGQVAFKEDNNGNVTYASYDPDKLYRLTNKYTLKRQYEEMGLLGEGMSLVESPPESVPSGELVRDGLAIANSDGSITLNNPVELIDKRDRKSESYLIGYAPDGKRIVRGNFYGGDINYYDGQTASFEKIDTSLIEDGGGLPVGEEGWRMEKASYHARLKKNLENDFVTFINQGCELSFSLLGKDGLNIKAEKTSEGKWTDKQAVYKDALGKGIDLSISLNNEALIKEAVINNLASLGSLKGKEYYEIPFKLTSNKKIDIIAAGKKLSEAGSILTGEGAEVVDEDGIKSYIWAPYAKDGSEIINSKNIEIFYEIKSDGIYLTKKIPVSWLKEANFPVRTDATVSYYSGAGDGRVSSDGYSTWTRCRNETMGSFAGPTVTDDYAAGSSFVSSTCSVLRGFFPVDTSALPENAVINSAIMKMYLLYVYDADNDGNDFMVLVQSSQATTTTLTADDFEQVGTTEGSDRLDLTGQATGEYKSFTLNGTGLGWINKSGNTMLALRDGHDLQDEEPSPGNYFYAYYSEEAGTSKDPYLEVVYFDDSSAPSAPSSLQTEGETNPGSVIDPTPEFSAIYNDQDNGDAAFYYRIQIAASANWTNLIWDSGKTALATSTPKGQRTEEIPYAGTALLADKTTYYWRIKLWDRIDFEGAWSTETASFYYANSYLQNLSYTYDKVGNITRIIDSSNMNTAKTLDFSYDDLHRLTVASSTNAVSGGNYRETYNYNAIGNITNKSDVGNYLYQGTNYANPHAATSINGATYSYDQNGNLTNDGAWTHSWDYNNRLTQSNNGTATTTYQYDQDGNRIKKAETTPTASSTTIYINQYYEVEGQDIRKYIFAGGERVASLIRQTIDINPDCTPPPSGDWTISVSCTFTGKARAQGDVTVNAGAVLTIADHSRLEIDLKNHKLLVRHNGGVLIKKGGTLRQTTEDSLDPEIVNSTAYHHADHLSGANADTDENGDVVQLLDYYPYGETRIDEKAGTYENDYKFAGYIRDEDSGLDYVGARYYNSGIGKWISQDPLFNIIGSGDINKDYENEYLSDPQKINSYSYVNNNPLYYIDPNGLTGIVFYGGNQENKNYFRDLAYKQAQTMIQNGFSEPIYVMEGSSPEMWNKTLNTKTDISYIGYYGHGSEQSLYLGNTTKTKPGTNMQTNTTASIMSNNKVSDFNPATDITVGQLSTKNIRKGDIKIELYSCRGGVGKNSIAEAFSRHFGASVQGARGGINFNSSGQAYISRPIYKEPSLFLEDALRSRLGLPNASIWRIFNN